MYIVIFLTAIWPKNNLLSHLLNQNCFIEMMKIKNGSVKNTMRNEEAFFFFSSSGQRSCELLPAHGTDDECHVHWSSV